MAAKERFTAPKGMRDIMPQDTPVFLQVERAFREVARRFAYREIRTPHLEATSLFVRTVGETTDIVEKEMYTLETKGGDCLALRPENTAGVVRAYLEHGLHRTAPLQRMFYFGEMFRHESAQKKRFREFTQAGLECFGSDKPEADAEVIAFVTEFYREVGLGDVRVEVSTFGCPECRPPFRAALQAYFAANESALCDDCKRRLDKNVFRLLDCKVQTCRDLADAAPRIDLDEACAQHYEETKRLLEGMGCAFEENPKLVRGLDYYSRTIFEVFPAGGAGRQDALCGGGRYDGLAELLGGPRVPAVGFAMGVDRIVMALADAKLRASSPGVDVYVVAERAAAEGAAGIAMELRRAGVSVTTDIARRKFPDKQLKAASKVGAAFALIIGGDELSQGKAVIKDLSSSEQDTVPADGVVAEMRNRIAAMKERTS